MWNAKVCAVGHTGRTHEQVTRYIQTRENTLTTHQTHLNKR